LINSDSIFSKKEPVFTNCDSVFGEIDLIIASIEFVFTNPASKSSCFKPTSVHLGAGFK
jgi:hypothetical protein